MRCLHIHRYSPKTAQILCVWIPLDEGDSVRWCDAGFSIWNFISCVRTIIFSVSMISNEHLSGADLSNVGVWVRSKRRCIKSSDRYESNNIIITTIQTSAS